MKFAYNIEEIRERGARIAKRNCQRVRIINDFHEPSIIRWLSENERHTLEAFPDERLGTLRAQSRTHGKNNSYAC
jgi:hypothetical protein